MMYTSPLELETEAPFPAPGGRSMTLDESVNLMIRLALFSPGLRQAAVQGLPILVPPTMPDSSVPNKSTRRRYK